MAKRLIPRHQVGKKLLNFLESFGNAQIAGDSGVGTAMAVASGYQYNPKTKKWEQSKENVKEAEGLRKGLVGIGTAGLVGLAAPFVAPVIEPALDTADTATSIVQGDYLGAVLNILPFDKIGKLFKYLTQNAYYIPKTKKILKEGLDKALKEGLITQDEYKDLQKIKIKPDYSGNFRSIGKDKIVIAPKYKGQDGGFSLFHELGHVVSSKRSNIDELAKTFSKYGKDYKYSDVSDLDKLQEELFADRFGFSLAGSRSLGFGNDSKNPDLIYRLKHYLNGIDWDNEFNEAIKLGDLNKAQELRNLHFLHSANKPTLTQLFRGTQNPTRTTFSTKIKDSEVGEMFGIYLTPSKKYASQYGTVKSYFTNVNNPLVTKGSWTGVLNNDKFNSITKSGYDHVINTNFDNSWFKKRPEVIIFNPNLIKSTDAITYDDFGNIIPLSKRDNFNLKDTRFKQGGKLNDDK